MKLRLLLLLIAIPMLCKAQIGKDHLTPSRDIWGIFDHQFEYYSNVRKVLLKDLSDKPKIRLMVMPSFTPESVLDIQETNGKYYLIYRIGESRIWSNDNWKKIKVKEYKSKIDSKSAELIKSLFLKAIKQTKYYEKDILGVDGVNYYFYAWDYGLKSGTTWSPNTPNMKKLVGLGNDLITLAKSNKTTISFDKKFVEEIESLIKDLQTNQQD